MSVTLLAAGPTRPVVSKFSGKLQCAKPDPDYIVPVGDRAGHVFTLDKYKCVWTEGEIAGIQAKSEEGTGASEVSGNSARDRGYAVATWANGDTTVSRYEGTWTLKGNAPVSGQGTWNLFAGSGKLKGIKGRGTFTTKFATDGTSTLNVEGDYQLPGASTP